MQYSTLLLSGHSAECKRNNYLKVITLMCYFVFPSIKFESRERLKNVLTILKYCNIETDYFSMLYILTDISKVYISVGTAFFLKKKKKKTNCFFCSPRKIKISFLGLKFLYLM